MQIDLSIIIPAYNCQNTIEKTVESVLKTKNLKYEIIIINDASTDNTPNIIKKYELMDNIKVINLDENHGVSYSRNLGIESAKGIYVAFLDSDDFVEEKMYERLFSISKKNDLDVCICGHFIVNDKTGVKQYSKYNTYGFFNSEDAVKLLLLDKISPAPCDKIFKRNRLKRFNTELKVGEDFLFCLENFFYSNKIKIIKDNYYNYVQNEKSTMHKFNKNLEQICYVDKYIPSNIQLYLEKKCRKEFEFFKLRNITRYVNSISNIVNKDNKHEIKEKIKEYLPRKKMLKIIRLRNLNKLIKVEIIIMFIFGINFHLLMMPIYKKIKENFMKAKNENLSLRS